MKVLAKIYVFFAVWQCIKVQIVVGVKKLQKNYFLRTVTVLMSRLIICGHSTFDFIRLEGFLKLNLIVYELEGKIAKLIQVAASCTKTQCE